MLTKTNALLALALALALSACGNNVFEKSETDDPAEDATIALENLDETAAIKILEDALEKDPGNGQYLSILALAYAQRAGIEPLAFAERVASGETDGASSSATPGTGDYTALFSVMPAATAKNLTDLDRACAILSTEIPADKAQPGDNFKLALYQTASFILHTKALDTNGDGQLSLDEILDLSSASATGLLSQIAAASAAFGGGAATDETQAKGAAAIAKFQAKIDAAAGDTQEEKLKNYLAGSGAASASTSDAAAQAAAAQAAAAAAGSGSSTETVPDTTL